MWVFSFVCGWFRLVGFGLGELDEWEGEGEGWRPRAGGLEGESGSGSVVRLPPLIYVALT